MVKNIWITRLLALLLAALAFARTAGAADSSGEGGGKSRQLSLLFPKYQDYLELAEERQMHFAPLYRLSMPEGKIESLEVSFEFEGKTYNVSPGADGIVSFRPSRDMLRTNPDLQIKNAVGRMTLKMQMEVLAGLHLRYGIADLHQHTHAAWAEAKKLAGVLSVFASKHSKLAIVFDEGCPEARWSVTDADDKELTGGVADKGIAQVDFGNKSIRHAHELTLACVPKRLLLDQ